MMNQESVFEVFYKRRPGHLVRRCQQIHVAIFLQECKKYDLTPVQYSILNVVNHIDGIEQSVLAGYVGLDKSTTGNVISRLEKRRVIKRVQSKNDRRIKQLFLSAKGKKLLIAASASVQKVQSLLLEPLDKNERIVFQQCLEKIANFHNEKSRAPLVQTFSET